MSLASDARAADDANDAYNAIKNLGQVQSSWEMTSWQDCTGIVQELSAVRRVAPTVNRSNNHRI